MYGFAADCKVNVVKLREHDEQVMFPSVNWIRQLSHSVCRHLDTAVAADFIALICDAGRGIGK